jgi:hypothetical protein
MISHDRRPRFPSIFGQSGRRCDDASGADQHVQGRHNGGVLRQEVTDAGAEFGNPNRTSELGDNDVWLALNGEDGIEPGGRPPLATRSAILSPKQCDKSTWWMNGQATEWTGNK